MLSGDDSARAAVTAGYTGAHDVLDAVWWVEHPLSVSPTGRADPAGELAALKTAAFSRNGSAADAAALADAESRLHSDAEALERAIQDARPVLDAARARLQRVDAVARTGPVGDPRAGALATPAPATPGAGAGRRPNSRGPAVPADHAAPTTRDSTPTTPDSTPDRSANATAQAWRRRSQLWMFTSLAAGLLLLAGVGLVVVQQLNPQIDLLRAGSATGADGTGGAASPTPTSSDTGSDPSGLTIFENPELAPAIPPQNIDPYYKPESLRLLGVADSDLTVYAVENRIDQPCLLAVYQDGTQSATCVTKQEFASMGIELRITSLRVTRPGDPAPYRSIAQDVVFWNPDGSYGVSSSPSTSPRVP
ncbi:hypothetical protein B7R25_13765 [Subtercola boreus]|uniref:Uncharacterized protein n=1 Tax=Subtercola boreus TaxID=120213 RepID=A0A3E0W760_9MICO|nr:hypothetical protein B7R24_13665 [Subtercola boreus]RFA18903.1 hypothetical protein B7R23_13655 [Subtercola boreus]RFA25439.1 hypothetical protein B7R25_13765 [Subtercola boreus]